jgi:hypothetical protein
MALERFIDHDPCLSWRPHAAEYSWPKAKPISKECKDLISKILVADAKKRYTIGDIVVCTHCRRGCDNPICMRPFSGLPHVDCSG